VHEKIGENAWRFIPTTPIPTSGFPVIVPVDKVTKLEHERAKGSNIIASARCAGTAPQPAKKSTADEPPMDADAKAGGQNFHPVFIVSIP